MKFKHVDITGKRFGTLTVTHCESKKGKKHVTATCVCDCGAIVEVRKDNLLAGRTKTCGKSECRQKLRNNNNSITEYVQETLPLDQEELQLEEMINTPFENRKRVSSINKLYHKAYELSKKPKKSARNSSGYVGVYWNKNQHRWIATIGFRGENIRIGSYQIFEDAVKARKEAEEMMFAPAIIIKKKLKEKSYKCVDNGSVA